MAKKNSKDDQAPDSLEMEREVEKEKKEVAIYDINQIRLNAENILKVTQMQLTKVLMDIGEIEKELSEEVNQYWLKELPVQRMIIQYVKSVSLLINLYTQQESTLKQTFEEIVNGIEFPDYNKIEVSYQTQLSELNDAMLSMKSEVEKVKTDLEEDYETAVKEESLKERMKLHKEYSEILDEADNHFDELISYCKKLQDTLEKNKISAPSPVQSLKKYLDGEKVFSKLTKVPEDSETVYIPQKTPRGEKSSKYEVYTPNKKDEKDNPKGEKLDKKEK